MLMYRNAGTLRKLCLMILLNKVQLDKRLGKVDMQDSVQISLPEPFYLTILNSIKLLYERLSHRVDQVHPSVLVHSTYSN